MNDKDLYCTPSGWMPGISKVVEITDCVSVTRDAVSGVARIDRLLESSRGYRWDGAGARIRFRTDSARVSVHLLFSARHLGPARNSIGFYRVDGQHRSTWRFSRPEGEGEPGDAGLVLELPVPAASSAGKFHDYEVILPYGDAVELRGIATEPDASWGTPAPRPAVRWVAFGDSVTQGFTATSVAQTYAFRVAEAMGWQVINAGIGGRGALAEDGVFLAQLGNVEVFTVAIGVNDWQSGTAPELFRDRMTRLLRPLCEPTCTARIYVLTPLWVAPSWQPASTVRPLEDYRAIIREVVAELANARVQLVEGPMLIDPDETYFDPVAVHPNDAGFAQMAERLVSVLSQPSSPS